MKLLNTFLLIFFASRIMAQMPSFNWGNGYGGDGTDQVRDMAIDTKGNQITVGVFRSKSIDMNPSNIADSLHAVMQIQTLASQDVFVSKYDVQGSLVWAYSIGNKGTDDIIDVELDNQNNIYILGTYHDSLDMDVKSGVTNIYAKGLSLNTYFAKYDKDFNLQWVRSLGSRIKLNSNVTGESIDIDNAGNLLVLGSFYGPVDFNPANPNIDTLNKSGDFDIYLAKYNSSGVLIWAKQFAVKNCIEKAPNSRKVSYCSKNNSIYLAGNYYGEIDLDPSATVNTINSDKSKITGNTDFYLANYDTLGNYNWSKNISNPNLEIFKSVDLDLVGNMYITGQFEGITDFNPDAGIDTLKSSQNAAGTASSLDLFFAKYDNKGNYVWANRISGSDNEIPTYIDVTSNGSILLTGNFRGKNIDFNPSNIVTEVFKLSVDSLSDMFVASYANDGSFNWAGKVGSKAFDYGATVMEGPKNTIYISGYSTSSVDMNMHTNSSDTSIYQRSKLSGTSQDFFIASYGGCSVNSEVSVNGFTLTANESDANATYLWVDCSTHKQLATTKNYTVTKDGNYKCIVTLNHCTDSSVCINITGTSINDIHSNNSFAVYPNPAHQNITISTINSSLNNNLYNIAITDILGKELLRFYNVNLSNTISNTIDISGLNTGIYFIKVDNELGKFIKNY